MLHQFKTTRESYASRALKGTPTCHITPPSPVTSTDANRHHLQRSGRQLPVAENKPKDQNQLLGWWPLCTSPASAPSSPLFCYPSSSSCPDWPWPSAQEQVLSGFAVQLEDKLPNTGWEQIETEWWMHRWGWGRGLKKKKKKKGGRRWFRGGGIVPKGVEVKRAGALICNSNEACLQ